ncbi:MAG: polysaccharide deacetylase family protein [Betaproteobacteria bacterium]|nr:polysaccharide deacetylase family protein [Betaproteobacteria bacterium]
MNPAWSPFRAVSPGGARAKANIFIFHRVHREPDSLFPGEMDAARFESLLKFLKRWFVVLPLVDLAKRLRDGTTPPSAACLTFDDGYADNLTVAAPLLERYRIPATVFVATAYLDGGRMWNDSIIESIRHCTLETLDLRDMDLATFPLTTIDDRRRAIESVLSRVKYLPLGRRTEVAERIVARARSPVPSDLMLTSTQLRRLASSGVAIGAHTRRHPILASEADDTAQQEIAGSKRDLEDLLQRGVEAFAYPNGQPRTDYRPTHVRMVRNAGFTCAVTTAHGVATPDADLLQLPRFTPWARNGLQLATRLGSHFARSARADMVEESL